jgi:signal transduction histidine kinase
MVAIAAVALWQLRLDALSVQEREIGTLSLALTGEIGHEFEGAEAGLHAMRVELSEGRLPIDGAQAGQALKTRAELMPLIRTIWLVDGAGHLLSSSDETPLPDLGSFAPALSHLVEGAIAVGRPFGDAHVGVSLVALATRFEGPAGKPGGWIVAAMPSTELLGAFSAAAPGADARMAVFRSDGVRLAGIIVAKPVVNEPRIAHRLANPRPLEPRRFSDGSDRLVAMHELPRYGLGVVLTRDVQAVLEPWREAARFTIVGLVLLLACITVSVELVLRADRRRTAAQRALQAQAARAGKLESLGTLAGGVAHDFNNVLAAIVGYGEMAQEAAKPGSDQARQLDRVMQAALRGKSLVARILAFSRGGARLSSVFEFQPVVEEVIAMVRASAPPGVALRAALKAPGARARGDATRAFEAVMNILTNAMQAMPSGGNVEIGLSRRHVATRAVLSHSPLAPGDYLALTVSDQGVGITPEVMEHLFEPFFTTRTDHAGTGLGLAVVHGVVTEFGGGLDVRGRPGAGASFTLYFPECADLPEKSEPPTLDAPRGHGQAILVVDDEPALVALMEGWLLGLGYEPTGFSDPMAAGRALQDNPRRFAAVIVDEFMPGASGTQLSANLRLSTPDLPVLLVSGYGGPLLAERAAAAGVTRVLAKPLQRAELANALAHALSG